MVGRIQGGGGVGGGAAGQCGELGGLGCYIRGQNRMPNSHRLYCLNNPILNLCSVVIANELYG